MNTLKINSVEEKILKLRGIPVILDSDVAELYGVETRDINKAVKNNPEKFPNGYLFEINKQEFENLRWKNSTTNISSMTRALPKAFTEKGLYMLATILKSPKATQTTIAIVETFTKLRELSRLINQLPDVQEKEQQKSLMQRSGELLAGILDDNLTEVTGAETTIEINLAVMKIKHTVKREKRKKAKE